MAPPPHTFLGAGDRPARPAAPSADGEGPHAGSNGVDPRDEHAFLRAVLDQLPVGVVVAEAGEGGALYLNATCERLLSGTTAWQEHGAALDRWTPLHLDGQPCRYEERPIRRALAGETAAGVRLQFPRPCGPPLVLRVSGGPVCDATGAVVAGVATFEDATGEHQAREALERLNAVLERQVAERTAEVRALTAALSQAEQHERARIAQVLHDELQQVLYGARLQLQGVLDEVTSMMAGQAGEAEHAATHRALGRAHELLGTAVTLTRTLALDLRPPIAAADGLAASLRWLGRHVRDVHGLRVGVRDEGAPPLPADVHDLLFQLARELLFNVVKHAGVDEAAVVLRTDGETLSLHVEDGGSGFDAALLDGPSPGGFGLRSIRERLAALGGRMAVDAAPGAGTRVTLTLPSASLSPDGPMEPTAASGRS